MVGFCFSFPVEQASVNSGKLLRWTKGYSNPGAIGNDPAKLLSDAFRRKVWFSKPCSALKQQRPSYQEFAWSKRPLLRHSWASMLRWERFQAID